MAFVLDATVAACWAFDDESHPTAASALSQLQHDTAVVPTLWWFELRNTLLTNERRARMTESVTERFLRSLSQLSFDIDVWPEERQVLTLARKHRLSVYDSSYLELAKRKNLALASLDNSLLRAAHAEHVRLIGPA
jgi:predicted nucleic acid-binding protein